MDVPAPQAAAVFPDQVTGLGQAFHRIHRGPAVGKGQFQADAAGAGPHVPGCLPGADGQLGQGLGPDGLFGHGDGLGPGEGAVGPAGSPGGGPGGRLSQQHRQGPEGLPGQFCRCAGGDGLAGAGQVFPHRHRQLSQPRLSQPGAEVGGAGALAAGEEKHRFPLAEGGHRVAAGAVGRHQLPVLPGPAQPGRQQLDAGNPRHHPGGDSLLGQPFQQARRPRIKAGVPAVEGRTGPGGLQHRRQYILKPGGGHPLGGVVGGQGVQQPPGPYNPGGFPQGLVPFRGEGGHRGPQPHQCHLFHSAAAFLHRSSTSS